MQVVLLDNIKGIGHVGDVKAVSDGYARNFLFPRKLAKPVTDGILKDVQALKAKRLQAQSLAGEEAKQIGQRIQGARIALTAKANEKGTLFAGIEAPVIAEAVSRLAGVHVAPDGVDLPEHIKTTGEHPVTIRLHDDVTAQVVVVVTPQ